MKKKVVIIMLVLLLAASFNAYSFGVGGAFGLNALGGLPESNVMLSAKFDSFPFMLGLGFTISQENFRMGVTADWHMVRQNLFSFVNFYAGPGLYLGIGNNFQLGARFPVALYIFPLDFLELFLEIAPVISATFDPIVFPIFNLQGAFGFRFWFN